jgi:malonate-semialdehyde dehydrogenase (acetylating)/methylmalonate-semialdehyde dehydrogenase
MHTTNKALDVISPLDGTHFSTVPLSSADDLNKAVEGSQSGFSKMESDTY